MIKTTIIIIMQVLAYSQTFLNLHNCKLLDISTSLVNCYACMQGYQLENGQCLTCLPNYENKENQCIKIDDKQQKQLLFTSVEPKSTSNGQDSSPKIPIAVKQSPISFTLNQNPCNKIQNGKCTNCSDGYEIVNDKCLQITQTNKQKTKDSAETNTLPAQQSINNGAQILLPFYNILGVVSLSNQKINSLTSSQTQPQQKVSKVSATPNTSTNSNSSVAQNISSIASNSTASNGTKTNDLSQNPQIPNFNNLGFIIDNKNRPNLSNSRDQKQQLVQKAQTNQSQSGNNSNPQLFISTPTFAPITRTPIPTSIYMEDYVAYNPLCRIWQRNICLKCSYMSYMDFSGICIVVDPLCKNYDQINGNCTDCYKGYQLLDGQCKKVQ